MFGRILLASILLTACWGLYLTHSRLERASVEAGRDEEVFYIPEARYVRPLLLGHEAFLADLGWIRALGYFSDQLFGPKKFTYLERLIDFITDLDPRFEKVYIWAGSVLMYKGGAITGDMVRASNRVLEKGWRVIQSDPYGWRHIPEYWYIPQMIGFNYAVELRDRKKGAPFVAAAARIPGSPDLYKTYAATLYKRAGEIEEGAGFLENMLAVETLQASLNSVIDPEVKKRIRDRLSFYYGKIYGRGSAEERVRAIEEKINRQISAWKESMPYISFDLFLLLTMPENESAESML